MHDHETLKRVGRHAASALGREWIHRRVETVTFPSPEDAISRRRVSVDFTIPDIAPLAPDSDRRYVPITVLEKWPPLLRLDLRDAENVPIPLLTREQNGVLDAAVLGRLAEVVLDLEELPEDLKDAISRLTSSLDDPPDGPFPASEALADLVPSLHEVHPKDIDRARLLLRNNPGFVSIAHSMRSNTFLWLRVRGEAGERQIIKFSYEQPLMWEPRPWSLARLGYRPFETWDPATHIGSIGSYHLGVVAPPPLIVTDAMLLLEQGRPDRPAVTVAACSAADGREDADGLFLHASAQEREARFYVSGDRRGASGRAYVAVIPDVKGFARGASLGASAMAALAASMAAFSAEALSEIEASVAILLIAPAFIQYLFVRPSEHVLVGGFLHGVRRVLLLTGLVPVLAALLLVLHGSTDEPPARWLEWSLGALACVSAVLAAVLWGVVFRARSGAMSPFSSLQRNILTREPTP